MLYGKMRQTDRQTDRQADRQTGRQTDRQRQSISVPYIKHAADFIANKSNPGSPRVNWLTMPSSYKADTREVQSPAQSKVDHRSSLQLCLCNRSNHSERIILINIPLKFAPTTRPHPLLDHSVAHRNTRVRTHCTDLMLTHTRTHTRRHARTHAHTHTQTPTSGRTRLKHLLCYTRQ